MRGGAAAVGVMWTVFAVETRDDNGNVTGVKTAVVDGETIKADTWYKLDGSEFVECDE